MKEKNTIDRKDFGMDYETFISVIKHRAAFHKKRRNIALWLGTIIGIILYLIFCYFMINKPSYPVNILKYIFLSYAITDMTIGLFRKILL